METPTAIHSSFHLELTLLKYVMLKLRCGALRDGENIQPVVRFYHNNSFFNLHILDVAVLTA